MMNSGDCRDRLVQGIRKKSANRKFDGRCILCGGSLDSRGQLAHSGCIDGCKTKPY